MKEPHEVVSWLGAMQAQAFEMAKWAIGSRLENSKVSQIEESLSSGKIIRTHILRPTWHFVAAEDIHWMRELSYQRLTQVYISYGKLLGADENMIANAKHKVAAILKKHGYLTKQEIEEHLKTAGLDIDQHTLTYLLSKSEIEGIVCNGDITDSNHTYDLLEKRVPKVKPFVKEEALARLAYKYFSGHGPATLQDFTWWSGLLASETKKGLESVKEHFVTETISGKTFWMKNDIKIPEPGTDHIHLLSPFDEFVVSYKDRSEIIEKKHYSKVMTKNGIFDPTIHFNGEIIGSWKKIKKKNTNVVELAFFEKIGKRKQDIYKQEIKRVEAFYNKIKPDL